MFLRHQLRCLKYRIEKKRAPRCVCKPGLLDCKQVLKAARKLGRNLCPHCLAVFYKCALLICDKDIDDLNFLKRHFLYCHIAVTRLLKEAQNKKLVEIISKANLNILIKRFSSSVPNVKYKIDEFHKIMYETFSYCNNTFECGDCELVIREPMEEGACDEFYLKTDLLIRLKNKIPPGWKFTQVVEHVWKTVKFYKENNQWKHSPIIWN